MVSRRNALKAGILTAGSMTGLPLSPHSQTQNSSGGRSSSTKNMHLSISAYSRREALNDGRMDLFRFIEWCSRLGVPGAELTSYFFPKGLDTNTLRKLRLCAFDNGITISGTAVSNNFCLPAGPEKQKEIDHVKQWIDYSAELFAPHIRIFAGDLPGDIDKKTGIGWAADGIRDVLEYASECGIILGLENHGGLTTQVEDHLAICDAVGEHPCFGINLDTGNYTNNPYEELERAAPRAVNVQIKVEVFKSNGLKEPADLERFRDILVEAGYKGWVALEYEARGEPTVEIPIYIRQLKRLYG